MLSIEEREERKKQIGASEIYKLLNFDTQDCQNLWEFKIGLIDYEELDNEAITCGNILEEDCLKFYEESRPAQNRAGRLLNASPPPGPQDHQHRAQEDGQVRQIVGILFQRSRRLGKTQVVQHPAMAQALPQVAEASAQQQSGPQSPAAERSQQRAQRR